MEEKDREAKRQKKIENLELIIQRQGFNLLAIHQLAKIISSNTDIRQIFFLITDMFAELFQLKHCISFMIRTEKQRFEFSFAIRFDEKSLEHEWFDIGATSMELLFSKERWAAEELTENLEDDGLKQFLKKVSAEYIFPLKVFDRKLGFVIFGPRYIDQSFDDMELVLIDTMQHIISTALYNAMTLDVLAEDHLTGLFTENYFLKRVEESINLARRYDYEFSIAIIELLNIQEWQKKGVSLNRILREVAQALKHTFRVTDYVSRYGTDKFGVLLNRASGENTKKPFERLFPLIKNYKLRVGVATFPKHGADREALLEHALSNLKGAGENEVQFS